MRYQFWNNIWRTEPILGLELAIFKAKSLQQVILKQYKWKCSLTNGVHLTNVDNKTRYFTPQMGLHFGSYLVNLIHGDL